MRKLLLIAAITVVSTAANAGPSRSLSLATADASPQVTQQPATQAADPTRIEGAKPGTSQAAAGDPATEDKPSAGVKPKRRQVSTEARIIYELHRHGIYW
jgi:hypothetical protein